MNIKKIIAREGLIFLLPVFLLFAMCHKQSSLPPVAVALIFLSVTYLIIRFIVWAIMTLKKK